MQGPGLSTIPAGSGPAIELRSTSGHQQGFKVTLSIQCYRCCGLSGGLPPPSCGRLEFSAQHGLRDDDVVTVPSQGEDGNDASEVLSLAHLSSVRALPAARQKRQRHGLQDGDIQICIRRRREEAARPLRTYPISLHGDCSCYGSDQGHFQAAGRCSGGILGLQSAGH